MACGLLVCTALGALSLPIRADAQFTGTASATGRFESNSNVFALQSGTTRADVNGPGRSDTYYAYGAEFDTRYLWGRQQLYATASTTESRYQHFTDLDHTDYALDAGLNWKLGSPWDGRLDVTRTRSMVPFLNLSGSVVVLTIATEQRETLDVGLKLADDWKVTGSASTSQTDQPIPDEPNLQLTQTSGTLALKYLGIGKLTSGITAGYLSGRYSGSNSALNASYDQETFGFLASYKVFNRTTFEGQVGYTIRSSATGLDNTSGLTARLSLEERLTPRTSFSVRIGRSINSYLPSLGSEIDTDAGVTVSWRATYKLTASLGYTFTYRDYPPQPGYAPGNNRVDYQQDATADLSYQPLRWLQIKSYARVGKRDSNARDGDFNSTTFGVALTATLSNNRNRR
jgi:Putative beta-barrel porin 2